MHREIYNGLKKALSYEVEQAHWIIRHQVEVKGREWMKNWDGRKTVVCYDKARCKCHNKKPGTHFPTGLLGMAMGFFDQYGISYDTTDVRPFGTGHLGLSMSDDFEIRDYQTEVIKKACHQQRGIIKMATGSGKSSVACGIIANLGVTPFIFYVTSQDLLHQAKTEIERFVFYNGLPIKVGAVGAGHKDIQDITVMTVQTAVRALGGVWVKYDEEDRCSDDTELGDIKSEVVELIKSARGVIFDECITGDSIVYTEDGPKKIEDLSDYKKDVLSFSGDSVAWNKILNFSEKGFQDVMDINLLSGKQIKCTQDHLIMTQGGWKEAGKVSQKDQVLSIAHVDVVKKSMSTIPTAWDINFVGIKDIKIRGKEKVYDIEVENAHNFFANDILVHNCQHVSSESCQIISDSSEMAQYKYGLSATPVRDKGDDLLIYGCFGKEIANISASFLIQRGYLVKPEILFLPITNMSKSPYKSYQKIYKHCLVNNSLRNEWIARLATQFANDGRRVLVLVMQIAHGKMLQQIIPGSVFLHGSVSKKKRLEHLQKMRDRESDAQITIASTILDEGIDVRPLDTLILSGAGKSSTRALQRVGRVLRPYDGKSLATIVDLYDHVKYLKDHAAKRESIYKTEEEFDIKYVSMES